MFIARKIKGDNIYILSHIRHYSTYSAPHMERCTSCIVYINVRPQRASLDIYEGGNIYNVGELTLYVYLIVDLI